MTPPVIPDAGLLPCPFCGGTAAILGPSVFCLNSVTCGGMLELHEEGRDAIAAWNRRVPIHPITPNNQRTGHDEG